MIPLEEAQRFISGFLSPLLPSSIALEDALGLVVSEGLAATQPIPRFPNSAMDGYALQATDTSSGSARLRVVGSVTAGDGSMVRVNAGDTVRIMTGALIPEGADCVVKVEEAALATNGQSVLINRVVHRGEHVRYPGEDVEIGQVLVTPGSMLGPTELGVLASQGYTSVIAHPRPRVGVLSTGNEIVATTKTLPRGKIHDVNRPMLLALLRESGFTPVDLGIARDDKMAITERFEKAGTECDAVISTGGVSVGDVDHVKTVIGELCGGRPSSMQVAIKPGKPFAFGVTRLHGTPIFGLAGNPVATRVGFEVLVRPALGLLAGRPPAPRVINLTLDRPLGRRRDGTIHLVYATARFHDDGRMHVESFARPGSHLLSAISGSNVIMLVPDGDGLAEGDTVRAIVSAIDVAATQPDE